MTTLRLAVERQRALGALPFAAQVSVAGLHRLFGPVAGGSTRGLLAAMTARGAERKPWAVMLCRFKGQAPDAARERPVEDLFRGMFTPGTGGLVEYWRDVSLGALDIAGSQVFGWIELEMTRAQAGGQYRLVTVDNAIKCAARDGLDVTTGFHSQIAVVLYNWSTDDSQRKPGTPTWKPDDPLKQWWPTWIDGSADGATGKVTLTPPFDGDITAHEMGHGFKMQHDVSADLQTHYADPCCIMSQTPVFTHPEWKVAFGPALCLPHLMQRGWMHAHRVLHDSGAWATQPGGISAPLARLTDPGARANLGMTLGFKDNIPNWVYFLEYVRPEGWNQGLDGDYLMIRRIATADVGETPSILGKLAVPAPVGQLASLVEPVGNVRFEVARTDAFGRVVKVSARKL